MELFLQECRPNLRNANDSSKIQIVLGNEACDLDSAVSALVTAFFLSKIQNATDVIVPVLNVKRKSLPLRTEVIYFLEETSIPLDSLICIDEIDLKALSKNENMGVVLVDHNTLSPEQSYLEPRITQVIDHHAVENSEKLSKYKAKIEMVGSCCTLVAEEIFQTDEKIMDPQIAMLLYGTILLDTICLQESAKRVTEKDKAMVCKLETFLEGITREEVFESLQRVKFDVSKLSPELLLQKDVKLISWESTNIAIAALPTLLQNVAESDTFLSALSQFASEYKLKSVILMGYKLTGDTMKRQIGIYDNSADSLEKITNYLLSLENPSLGLQPLPFSGKSVALFDQENIALTRKFVLPAMQNYLKCNSGR